MDTTHIIAVTIMTGLVTVVVGCTVKAATNKNKTALLATLSILTGWLMVAIGLWMISQY